MVRMSPAQVRAVAVAVNQKATLLPLAWHVGGCQFVQEHAD
jgi:hypothetical protein